ncbi:MAG: HAD family hydrolase [Flavobacteriaceae bacterium]
MINTLIFDFGNVFINLDIENAAKYAFEAFEIHSIPEDIAAFNNLYEQGLVSTEEFTGFYVENFPQLSKEKFIHIWNAMLKDFPERRLKFIQQLKKEGQYKLILLSNTNALHIDYIQHNVPFYNAFKNSFDAFYLSHEINLRKPDKAIFEFVLTQNRLTPENCLFIDDNKQNCETANNLGINTWHINPETEDVSLLFKTKKHLF